MKTSLRIGYWCAAMLLVTASCQKMTVNHPKNEKKNPPIVNNIPEKMVKESIDLLASKKGDWVSLMTEDGMREHVLRISFDVFMVGVNNDDDPTDPKLRTEAGFLLGWKDYSIPVDFERGRRFIEAVLADGLVFKPGGREFPDSSFVQRITIHGDEKALAEYNIPAFDGFALRFKQRAGKWLFDGYEVKRHHPGGAKGESTGERWERWVPRSGGGDP